MPPAAHLPFDLLTASYESGSDAVERVVDTLGERFPDCDVLVGRFDATEFVVVGARGVTPGIATGVSVPLGDALCPHMAVGSAPRLCHDLADEPVYAACGAREAFGLRSYVGVPVALADGRTVGSLCIVSGATRRFREDDRRLLSVLARMLAFELERDERRSARFPAR